MPRKPPPWDFREIQDEDEDQQPLPQMIFWVEGQATVEGWEAEKRLAYDQLREILRPFGFLLRDQESRQRDVLGKRRRWTQKRITKEVALIAVETNPGKSARELACILFYEPDWTVAEWAYAAEKVRSRLFPLMHNGDVLRRFLPNGTAVYYHRSNMEAMALSETPNGVQIGPRTDIPKPDAALLGIPPGSYPVIEQVDGKWKVTIKSYRNVFGQWIGPGPDPGRSYAPPDDEKE